MTLWHYSINGQQLGPVSAEEIQRLLAAGTINGSSLVWRDGLANWLPLSAAMPELMPSTATVAPGQPVAPDATSPVQPSYNQPEQSLPFEFHGRTGEYFRIWIVNVVLTVITLGIYAAWAKVRTRRYFYGNTLLDGKPFDFTGNPISILKGNLIFGGLFILYSVSGAMFPKLAIVIFLAIFCIAPWLVWKALRFRAHNTVHRNVRFNFRGTVSDAYSVFLGMAILIPFTLGLIVPHMQFRQKQYFLGNMAWGNAWADMRGSSGFYYKTFFKSIGLFFILALLGGIVAGFNSGRSSARMTMDHEGRTYRPAPGVPSEKGSKTHEQIEMERIKLRSQPPPGVFAGILGTYAFMFALGLYYKVRTNNYALNVTQWGNLGRIESKVRVRDLFWLYLTNGIVILCTSGLAIPWVKIRMARYNTSRITFIASSSLDAVAQAQGSNDSAMGDAGADIFDFEVGF